MTRKKFVKLVMCHGLSIRGARSIAQYAWQRNIPYAEYYPYRFGLDIAVKRMAAAAKLAQEYFKQTVQKIVRTARENGITKEEKA